MIIQEDIPLAPCTTFGIGGPARFFVRVENMGDLYEALAFAKEKNLTTFTLGGGSNVLIDDGGFDGLVLKIALTGIDLVKESDSALMVAAAGEDWDTFVERAVQENLWGVENLSGIPGTIGGAVVQNIGAYGAVLSQTLEWVEVLDRQTNTVKTLTKEACKFGYRESVFKQEPERYVVLYAAFTLTTVPEPNISYKDLSEYFKERIPSLLEVREAILLIRKKKFPDMNNEGTAGSFFKNPIVSAAEAEKLVLRYPGMPVFHLPESSDVKIPLGWLLDFRHKVLDVRAIRVGGARMYEHQFLVIVAQKNTTAHDVKELARLVQKKVLEVCGISIEPEVHIVTR